MAFPSGYAGYDTITPANPAGALTDFFYVLNLNLLSSTWWANVKSDGGDVQVYVEATGDRLPVYLHNWNYGANSGLLFFQFTGTKSTSSESVRVYAGNASESQPAAGAAYGQYAVFPSHVRAYHPDGGGNDVTSNANNFTMSGAPTVGGTAGPVSGSLATNYNGTSQYGIATNSVPSGQPNTLLASFRPDRNTASECILALLNTAGTNTGRELNCGGATAGDPIRAVELNTSGIAVTATGISTATYFRGSAVFNTTTDRKAGIDGALTQNTTSATASTNSLYHVASRVTRNTLPAYFDGRVSCASLHDSALSDDWIAYDAAMMAAGTQSGFYTAGGWTVASSGTIVSPGAASATASAVDPAVILGSVSVSPGNASATATAVDPTVMLGSVTVAPGDATATGSAVDPTVVLGSITISPGAAEATASVVDPAVTGDGISVAPGAASATASAVDPTVILGSITVSPGAAQASGAAVDPSVILGSVIVSPGAAVATASAIAPTVISGVLVTLPRFAMRLEFVVQVTIFPPGAEIEAVYAPLLGIEAAAPPLYNETHAPALGLEEIR